MKKSLNFPYTVIDNEIICEHKRARVDKADISTVHNHDGYEVVLFLDGDVNMMIEPELIKMKPGDIFLISPLVFHGVDLVDVSGYERIVINIQYEYLRNLGFKKSFIPSDKVGLYERFGYSYVKDITNYGGQDDHLYEKFI